MLYTYQCYMSTYDGYLVGYKAYDKTNLDTPCDTTAFNLLKATLNFQFYSNIPNPLAHFFKIGSTHHSVLPISNPQPPCLFTLTETQGWARRAMQL